MSETIALTDDQLTAILVQMKRRCAPINQQTLTVLKETNIYLQEGIITLFLNDIKKEINILLEKKSNETMNMNALRLKVEIIFFALYQTQAIESESKLLLELVQLVSNYIAMKDNLPNDDPILAKKQLEIKHFFTTIMVLLHLCHFCAHQQTVSLFTRDANYVDIDELTRIELGNLLPQSPGNKYHLDRNDWKCSGAKGFTCLTYAIFSQPLVDTNQAPVSDVEWFLLEASFHQAYTYILETIFPIIKHLAFLDSETGLFYYAILSELLENLSKIFTMSFYSTSKNTFAMFTGVAIPELDFPFQFFPPTLSFYDQNINYYHMLIQQNEHHHLPGTSTSTNTTNNSIGTIDKINNTDDLPEWIDTVVDVIMVYKHMLEIYPSFATVFWPETSPEINHELSQSQQFTHIHEHYHNFHPFILKIFQISHQFPDQLLNEAIQLLIGLCNGSHGSTAIYAYHFINESNWKFLQFPKLFQRIQSIIQMLSTPETNLSTTSNSSKTITQMDLNALNLILQLFTSLLQSKEVAEELMKQYQLLIVLFKLLSCPLPHKIKGIVLSTITQLATWSEYVEDIWYNIELYSLFPTSNLTGLQVKPMSNNTTSTNASTSTPLTNDPKVIGKLSKGICSELEEVEAKVGEYPMTIQFLRLFKTLIQHCVPHQLGLGYRVPGILPYVEFITQDIFLKVTQRYYAPPSSYSASPSMTNDSFYSAVSPLQFLLQPHTNPQIQPQELREMLEFVLLLPAYQMILECLSIFNIILQDYSLSSYDAKQNPLYKLQNYPPNEIIPKETMYLLDFMDEIVEYQLQSKSTIPSLGNSSSLSRGKMDQLTVNRPKSTPYYLLTQFFRNTHFTSSLFNTFKWLYRYYSPYSQFIRATTPSSSTSSSLFAHKSDYLTSFYSIELKEILYQLQTEFKQPWIQTPELAMMTMKPLEMQRGLLDIDPYSPLFTRSRLPYHDCYMHIERIFYQYTHLLTQIQAYETNFFALTRSSMALTKFSSTPIYTSSLQMLFENQIDAYLLTFLGTPMYTVPQANSLPLLVLRIFQTIIQQSPTYTLSTSSSSTLSSTSISTILIEELTHQITSFNHTVENLASIFQLTEGEYWLLFSPSIRYPIEPLPMPVTTRLPSTREAILQLLVCDLIPGKWNFILDFLGFEYNVTMPTSMQVVLKETYPGFFTLLELIHPSNTSFYLNCPQEVGLIYELLSLLIHPKSLVRHQVLAILRSKRIQFYQNYLPYLLNFVFVSQQSTSLSSEIQAMLRHSLAWLLHICSVELQDQFLHHRKYQSPLMNSSTTLLIHTLYQSLKELSKTSTPGGGMMSHSTSTLPNDTLVTVELFRRSLTIPVLENLIETLPLTIQQLLSQHQCILSSKHGHGLFYSQENMIWTDMMVYNMDTLIPALTSAAEELGFDEIQVDSIIVWLEKSNENIRLIASSYHLYESWFEWSTISLLTPSETNLSLRSLCYHELVASNFSVPENVDMSSPPMQEALLEVFLVHVYLPMLEATRESLSVLYTVPSFAEHQLKLLLTLTTFLIQAIRSVPGLFTTHSELSSSGSFSDQSKDYSMYLIEAIGMILSICQDLYRLESAESAWMGQGIASMMLNMFLTLIVSNTETGMDTLRILLLSQLKREWIQFSDCLLQVAMKTPVQWRRIGVTTLTSLMTLCNRTITQTSEAELIRTHYVQKCIQQHTLQHAYEDLFSLPSIQSMITSEWYCAMLHLSYELFNASSPQTYNELLSHTKLFEQLTLCDYFLRIPEYPEHIHTNNNQDISNSLLVINSTSSPSSQQTQIFLSFLTSLQTTLQLWNFFLHNSSVSKPFILSSAFAFLSKNKITWSHLLRMNIQSIEMIHLLNAFLTFLTSLFENISQYQRQHQTQSINTQHSMPTPAVIHEEIESIAVDLHVLLVQFGDFPFPKKLLHFLGMSSFQSSMDENVTWWGKILPGNSLSSSQRTKETQSNIKACQMMNIPVNWTAFEEEKLNEGWTLLMNVISLLRVLITSHTSSPLKKELNLTIQTTYFPVLTSLFVNFTQIYQTLRAKSSSSVAGYLPWTSSPANSSSLPVDSTTSPSNTNTFALIYEQKTLFLLENILVCLYHFVLISSSTSLTTISSTSSTVTSSTRLNQYNVKKNQALVDVLTASEQLPTHSFTALVARWIREQIDQTN